jgi:very-short-patch-repair endonuclease
MRLTPLARKLRQRQTDAEGTLWYYLRAKQIDGLKFKRQQPIGNYIVDFVCLAKKIIIELDGSQHIENEAKDKRRDAWLKTKGYKVLRFSNIEFFENKDAIIEEIAETCLNRSPSP